MTSKEIIALEEAFQIPTYSKMPVALVKGEGSFVWDAEGRRYLDYYGGHCVTGLGHCPPAVVDAVCRQAGTLLFYSNMVYCPVRARAAELLASMAPPGLRKVFFCNSGTEANETALKLARKFTGKSGLIAMEGSFHGRTLGSLAATWGMNYREPYLDVLPDTIFVPYRDPDAVARVLESRSDVAAVLLEPIQWGGMWAPPARYFQALRRLCDQHGCLLIFDEVQTGVGRTGTFSISESLGVRPDLITLAKSLGSGLPVGAVLVSDTVAASVKSGDQGTTFGGGMLAMAAVTATLETIRDERLMDRAMDVFAEVHRRVGPLVQEVRGAGCLIGFDLGRPVRPVLEGLRNRGVLAGSTVHPHVVRIMPPLNTTGEEIDLFVDAFGAAVRDLSTTSA